MTRKAICKEAAAVLAVLLVLAGLPLLLWYWRGVVVPARYAPGTKIIHLTAIANGGIWTQEQIAGYNYWWIKPTRAHELSLTQGDRVALLLHSPDVQHSFAVRDLHIGPVAVPAGHTVEVKFDVDSPTVANFLCMQVCGRDHSRLEGFVRVGKRGTEAGRHDHR